MERISNRNNSLETGIMREPAYGPILLDIKSKTLCSKNTGELIKLGNQEYQILWLLIRAQGGILSRADIEDFLYEDRPEENDLPLGNTLDVHLNALRNKLQTVSGDKVFIENTPGVGWKLILT